MNLFMETIEEDFDSLSEFAKIHRGPYFVSYEVFVIRIHFDTDREQWAFSTKGKPNAFHSFWAERRSFGNLFLDELNGVCGQNSREFVEKLHRNVEYYFLVPLRHKNRVLLTHEDELRMSPNFFLGGVVERIEAGGARVCIFETAEECERFKGPWEFLPRVDPADYDPESFPFSIGLSYCDIGAQPCPELESPSSDTFRLVRFLLPIYARRRQWRNNTADIFARYGELWHERSPMLSAFKAHYAEYLDPFDAAIDDIYDLYQKRYVHNEYANTTPLKHAILKKIKLFQQRKNWNEVTRNNIYSIVFRNFGSKLYKI